MKKTVQKYFMLSILFINSIQFITCADEQQPIPQNNPNAIKQNIEAEREFLEKLITTTRQQTEQINFCLQQILQALQANRLKGSKKQIQLLTQEIVAIQGFTQIILNKVLTQINPEAISVSLILNGIITNYLLKNLKENPLLIKSQTLNELVDTHLQEKLNHFKPQDIDKTIQLNQKRIDNLLNTTDYIGLSWYNQIYRCLKRSNAYEYARFAGITSLTAVAALIIYNHYTSKLPHLFGKPGRYKEGSFDPKTGKGVYIQGSGVYKITDALSSAKELSLLAVIPMTTLDLNAICTSLYYKYWLKVKDITAKRWKEFDEICTGSDKKYSACNSEEQVYFKDMTGAQHLEELAKKITNFMKYPERYERSQIEEHRGILLYGPPQTGKTLFAKALRTMVAKQLGDDKRIMFIDAKKILDMDPKATIEEIFYFAQSAAPAILFFDEIDLVGAHREKDPFKTGQLLTCMQGLDIVSKQVIVIGATNKPEQLDKALLVDGRFGKIIHVDYPNYTERKSYLEQQISKRNLQVDASLIEYIAQETEGASYNKLRRIIMEALINSTIELRAITPEDFEVTLDAEVRKIKKLHAPISEYDKQAIATYQAGKALVRQLLKTKKEVVKATIHPVSKNVKTNEHGWAIKTDNDNDSQNDKHKEEDKEQKMKHGEVFTKTSFTNDSLFSDTELEKEALALLAGNIAQKVLLESTFTNCNPHDRAEAMKIIYTLVSQGEKIDKMIKAEALNRKATYEKQLEELLIKHKTTLQKIVDKLVTDLTINREEWTEIAKTIN